MLRLSRSLRVGLAAGGAVLVLGGAAVGIAVAQTPTPTAQTGQARYQAFVDALAKRLGISSATLQTAISGARTDAGLPANGQGGPGFAPGGRRGPGGPRGPGGGIDWNAAATAIGIPAAQLRTEIAGKSLAQVATAHGKTADEVATALKNAAHTRIDQAVSAGKLTADQATTQKTQVDLRLDQLVNQVLPQGGHWSGPGGRGGPGGQAGPGRRGGPGGQGGPGGRGGPGGQGGPGGRGGPGGQGGPGGRGAFGLDWNAAATAIGIPVAQLQSEVAGKSLAQVATAHGKTADEVATALKNAANTRVDQAVSAGRLTADQATAQKTQIDQHLDQFVNQVLPQGGAPGPRGTRNGNQPTV